MSGLSIMIAESHNLVFSFQASVPKEGMNMLSACITMPWPWLMQLSLPPCTTTRTTADQKQLLTGPVGICSSWRYAAALRLEP